MTREWTSIERLWIETMVATYPELMRSSGGRELALKLAEASEPKEVLS